MINFLQQVWFPKKSPAESCYELIDFQLFKLKIFLDGLQLYRD